MSLSLKGTIKQILSEQSYSPKFKKQSIHLTTKNGNYDTTVEVDFVNNQIGLLAGYMPGEEVEVQINIKGNQSKKDANKIFNSVTGWKIERTGDELTNAIQNEDRFQTQNDLSF